MTKTGQTESKNHHYVPQCILKNFCIPSKNKKQVAVFDKLTGAQYSTSIRNAGSENNFNSLHFGDEKSNFEEVFQDIDTLTGSILKKIISSEDLQALSEEEAFNLIEITLVQLLRTKVKRTALIEMSNQFRQLIQPANLNLDPTSKQSLELDENDAKLISLRQLGDIGKLIPLLATKTLTLLKTTKSKPFWISDNPVVLHNKLPYGDLGLGSKGVEIYFPVSSTLCVAFSCPTILFRQERDLDKIYQKLNLPVAQEAISVEDYTGLIWPRTIAAEHKVESINKLQVASSSRFLYSSNNNFSIAKAFLKQYPQYREVKSQYELSGMGQPKSRNPRMPSGDILVIFGTQDHYMLSIQYVKSNNSSYIEFFTTDFDTLKMIEADSPFEEVTVYRNGYPTRGMREAKFKDIDYSGKKPIKIVHTDEELAQILELRETGSCQ